MADPLQCTFTDAARNHLRNGIRLSTAAKVDFFEAMVTFAVNFGARDRTREREAPTSSDPNRMTEARAVADPTSPL